ncbi:MAG: 1-(5-phosphoribosyl)-5-[(5-phosphoribosylamino)methylideneamino]imidazole-4-carboxamide isomerase [Pirellulales bacterium]|nr:1-(5-phosphoribosyl)-5-[(5-phosphoribosylamino)methylideneamino]imidazole-4-carboxamide isomerase [Pirellulales bacterium]
MQVWPAIDLRNGHCVRLQQGDYARETIFDADPVNAARRLLESGAPRLHIVDLDGARDGVALNRDPVRQIVSETQLPCQVGGGIRDEAAITTWIEAGVSRLVIGTRGIRDPKWFREMCHKYPGKLVLGIDARDGKLATDGWQTSEGREAVDLALELDDEPLAAFLFTDIATDGMLAGPNLAATRSLCEKVRSPVLASGGVTTVDDIAQLKLAGAAGCIIGRALYEERISVKDALLAAGDL